MTFSNGGGPGQHFRGRYSPAKPEPAPTPQEMPAPQERQAPQPLPETSPQVRELPRPAGALLAMALLAGAVAIGAVLLTKQSATQAPLSWQSSCGSAPVSGSRWWPVLGPADAVETIRSRYCGDAYVTAYGFAQVASFSSVEEATAFAQRLSDASGYSLRVGEPRTP